MKNLFLSLVILCLVPCGLFSEPVSRDTRLVINSGSRGWIMDQAITRDGRFLIAGGDDNNVVIWDLELGKVVRALTGHSAGVAAVSLSADETIFATASRDTVKIWELQTGTCLKTVKSGSFVYDISISPDGRLIAGTGFGGSFIIQVSDGEIIKKLPEVSFFTAFSPDGASLYVGHTLYDAARWQIIKKFPGDDADPEYGELSRDGRRLVLVRKNGTACMINTETGKQLWDVSGIKALGHPAAFYPDGASVCLSGGSQSIDVLDSLSGKKIRAFRAPYSASVAVLPDGKQVITSTVTGDIKVYENDPEAVRTISGASHALISSVKFRKNGSMLFLASSSNVVALDLDKGSRVRFGSHREFLSSSDVSMDGSRAVTGGGDKLIKIWDTASGHELFSLSGFFSGHSDVVNAVAFSPDGKYIVSCGADKKVILWDAVNGKAEKKLTGLFGGSNAMNSVVFNPDGTRIAVGDSGGTLTVWSIPEGQEVSSIPAVRISINSVAWSPDGQYIVAGGYDGEMCIVDAATGNVIKRMKGHENSIQSLAFSPDSRIMASGGSDNVLALWDTSSWKQTQVLREHLGPVKSLSFRPDNGYLASAAWDGSVRFWRMPDCTPAGIYMEMTTGNSVVAASDGRYDADEKTVNILHWVSGMEVVPLQSFGQDFKTNDLLPLLFKTAAASAAPQDRPSERKADVDVSRQLVGKVFSVSGNEVIVAASSSGLLKVRDRLFVLVDGKRVALEAVMPMHTSVKCRVVGQGKVSRGMPVFK